jgi:hypothetical protein
MNGRSGLRTEVVAERDKPVRTCVSANPRTAELSFEAAGEWVRNVEVEGTHDALLSPEPLARGLDAEPVQELITSAAQRLGREPSVRPSTPIGDVVAQVLIDAANGDLPS